MSDEEPPLQDVLNAHQNTSIASPTIEEYPRNRQAGCPIASISAVAYQKPNYNPLFPFSNTVEYKLAQFFTFAKVTKSKINEFFHDGLHEQLSKGNLMNLVFFSSEHTLHKLIDTQMKLDVPLWTIKYIPFKIPNITHQLEWHH